MNGINSNKKVNKINPNLNNWETQEYQRKVMKSCSISKVKTIPWMRRHYLKISKIQNNTMKMMNNKKQSSEMKGKLDKEIK